MVLVLPNREPAPEPGRYRDGWKLPADLRQFIPGEDG